MNGPGRGRAHDVLIYLPSIGGSIDPRSSTGGGGAETQMLLLAQGLAALGARVSVAAFADGKEPAASVDGVTLVPRAPYQARQGARGKLREAAEVYRSLAAADAETVVARVATPAIALVAWAAKLQHCRFVYSSANITDFEHATVEPSRRNQRLVRRGIAGADRIVVQTEEQRQVCERVLGRVPELIRSIAQPAEVRDGDPEAFLWVGRLTWYKRPLAYVDLARAVPEARFRMVCVVEPSAASRTLLKEVRCAAADVPNLELLPAMPRAELGELIARSVAIVNTSDYEGLSNVLLEGWARGIPGLVLSYDPDGLVRREGLGTFAGGSREQLAQLVRASWKSRNDQDELARRCRRYVSEHHSPEAVYARWWEILGLGPTPEAVQPGLVGVA